MPRKKQRFSRLLRELKGTGTGNPESGRTKAFLDYLKGVNKVTQTNKVPDAGRELFEIALYPFALTPSGSTPDQRYKASISVYSLNGLSSRATGINEEKLGINRIAGGERENADYYPALMRASFSRGGASTQENKISGITKEPYKYVPKRTFSFPFGRTTSVTDAGDGTNETVLKDVDELDVYRFNLNDIKAPSNADNIPSSVSYEAEVFKTDGGGKALETSTQIPTVNVG